MMQINYVFREIKILFGVYMNWEGFWLPLVKFWTFAIIDLKIDL